MHSETDDAGQISQRPQRRKRLSRASLSIDGGASDIYASIGSISIDESTDVEATQTKSMWPIILQDHVFNSREEMFQTFAVILQTAPLGVPLSLSDQRLVVRLLRVAHPRACEKIGTGVRRVAVEAHIMFPAVRNFVVFRGDSQDNFSYRKCINNLTGYGWTLETPLLIQLQHQAKKAFHHRSPGDPETYEGAELDVGPSDSFLQDASLPPDILRERERLIDDVFLECDRLGGSSAALLAFSTLRTCVRYDSRRAAALLQEQRFLSLESHLTPKGVKHLVRSHHAYLITILDAIKLPHYCPPTAVMEALTKVAKQRLRRFNYAELCSVICSYAYIYRRGVPPGDLIRAFTQRFLYLLRRFNDAPVATVAAFYHAAAVLGPVAPDDQHALLSRVIEHRESCSADELASVVLAAGLQTSPSHLDSHNISLLLDSFLAALDTIDECIQILASMPPPAPSKTQAVQLQRMLTALQRLRHRPSPSQLLHICTLLEAHGPSLHSPHVMLSSLAALGVAPLSAHSGPGVVDTLIAAARSQLTAPSGNGAPALSCSWALAMLQRGDVTGFKDIWATACSQFKSDDKQEGCRLYHTAMMVHFEVPKAADVLARKHVMNWAQQMWLQDLSTQRDTDLHCEVATVLTALGLHCVLEHLTTDGLQRIDLALCPPPFDEPQSTDVNLQQPSMPHQNSSPESATSTAAVSTASNGSDEAYVTPAPMDDVTTLRPARSATNPTAVRSNVATKGTTGKSSTAAASETWRVAMPTTGTAATSAPDRGSQWAPPTAAVSAEATNRSQEERRTARIPEWHQSDLFNRLGRRQWGGEAPELHNGTGAHANINSNDSSSTNNNSSNSSSSSTSASSATGSREDRLPGSIGSNDPVKADSDAEQWAVWGFPDSLQLPEPRGSIGSRGSDSGNEGIFRSDPEEQEALPRSIMALSNRAVAALDADILQDTLQSRWASSCSPSLHQGLEATLSSAQLPRVAIQIDDSSYWASNCRAPLGHTQTRNRMLIAQGWKVVTVGGQEWVELQTGAEKAAYMTLRLRDAGVAIPHFRLR